MTLGEIIKQYREAHDLSMGDFANLSGMSKAYVSLLERGIDPRTRKAIRPSEKTIRQAANAMGTSAAELSRLLTVSQLAVTLPITINCNTIKTTRRLLENSYPYKKEIEAVARQLNTHQLEQLLQYARFLLSAKKEAHG